jgi:hypothetical protein
MRSPIITDTGIWDVQTWGAAEQDSDDLPTSTALRTQTGLAAFLARGYELAKNVRESAEEAGYVVLEDPKFHIITTSVYERNRPRIACEARVIAKASDITSLSDTPSPGGAQTHLG